jgi:hypothetical protein
VELTNKTLHYGIYHPKGRLLLHHRAGQARRSGSDLGLSRPERRQFARLQRCPYGANQATQLTIFPEVTWALVDAAKKTGMHLEGPHHAILVQGDDELGALINVHERLAQANVNVYASNAVTDGKGSYGYLIFVRPDDFQKAASALRI